MIRRPGDDGGDARPDARAGRSLMMFSHAVMIAGMVVMMVYRLDRYAHVAHDQRT
jgi:hypothetical protein